MAIPCVSEETDTEGPGSKNSGKGFCKIPTQWDLHFGYQQGSTGSPNTPWTGVLLGDLLVGSVELESYLSSQQVICCRHLISTLFKKSCEFFHHYFPPINLGAFHIWKFRQRRTIVVSREVLPKNLLFLLCISASLNGLQKAVTLLRMDADPQNHASCNGTLKTKNKSAKISLRALNQMERVQIYFCQWRKNVSKKARRWFKTSREFCG